MINNRQQAGRRRGRGGNGNGGGGGGGGNPRQGGQARGDNGNRIDSRSRGNASQLYEKYKNLAADAQRQGDRVNTEYYLQFADHYFRVLSDQRGRSEEPQQPRRQQPDFDIDGADDDYGDEGEPIRAGEQQGQQGSGRQGYDQQQNDPQEPRGDRQRDRSRQDGGDRPRQDGGDRPRQDYDDRSRQDGPRQDGPRQDGPRQDGGERLRQDGERSRPDGDRLRQDGERPRRWERDDRPRRQEGEVEVGGQHRADPVMPGENLEARAEAVIEADAPLGDPAPRRRGRPRRESPATAETTGSDEPSRAAPAAAIEDGVDADRLPPSLGASFATPANDAGDDAPKPRRRRVRAAATGDTPAE